MIVLTLFYPNGTSFIVGGFNTMGALDAWLSAERAKDSWDPAAEVQIVDNTPPPGGAP